MRRELKGDFDIEPVSLAAAPLIRFRKCYLCVYRPVGSLPWPTPYGPPSLPGAGLSKGPGQQKRLDVNLITLEEAESDVSRMAGHSLRRTVMKHLKNLETLLIVIALGAIVASPAFARSENGHQQRFTWSALNVH
jgi:hypothetical protein